MWAAAAKAGSGSTGGWKIRAAQAIVGVGADPLREMIGHKVGKDGGIKDGVRRAVEAKNADAIGTEAVVLRVAGIGIGGRGSAARAARSVLSVQAMADFVRYIPR